MKRILIIEDSKSVAKTLSMMIKEELDYETIIGTSFKECANLILKYKGEFDVALLDLGLPDSDKGEIVDFVTKFSIPTIILTGSSNLENEIKYRNKNIVDYVVKDGLYSFKYAISVIKRVIYNENIGVLIVDDSKSFLSSTKNLIERYKLTVFTATNGKDALDLLKENKNIKIILTDYYMPIMDGLELVRTVRKSYSKDDLSIIVTSAIQAENTASKFLKYGANDFLYKGFTQEELFVRINANLEVLELFEELKNRANKDFLTNLYNRRYLFQEGTLLLEEAIKDNKDFFVALIDIDKFKNINDTYGHDVGDIAIKEVAQILNDNFNDDVILSRIGGEEFCLLFANENKENVKNKLESIREYFENKTININDINLNFTVSIGICFSIANSLDEMLREADKYLYSAKDSGRNKVRYRK